MFSKAIVRTPCESMVSGITTADLGQPDYAKALIQHRAYVDALQRIGLDITVLGDEEQYPDSVFIEDTALVTNSCAVITRPGADSRKGEVVSVKTAVEKHFNQVYEVESPGCVDAGDIMMVGSHFYIGLSDRTNQLGADQMTNFLSKHSMTASTVVMNEMLHLKTGLSYLENNNLLITGEFVGRPEFDQFNQIEVKDSESYAANSVWVNGHVLVPADHPVTSLKITELGYQVIELEMTEFQKLDGGLSCLSLRF